MKRITLLLIALGLSAQMGFAQGGRIVCDETCRIEYQKTETALPKQAEKAKAAAKPAANTTAAKTTATKTAAAKPAAKSTDKTPTPTVPGYAVVSPVGRTSVEMITQAPRLESLEGKTIAVVGVSFMTGVTHPEIKRLIKEHYPSAKVLLLDEIGFSGPYPAPGVTRRQNEEFKQKLREMNVDAVISGNGGCGLCTPKETGSCITAEYLGIPSVIIAGPGFADQARYTARNNGVPVMRVAEYPGAFAADSEETLLKNTREILWPQIVEALTKPITADEIAKAEKDGNGDIRDDVFYGTLDEIDDYFRKQNWTDGLPIVPPTFDKVTEYMKYTPYGYDQTVAVLPIAHRDTKAWHVAVNAVMAGCKPEYMPILIALTKGLGDGNFRRTLASTHAWAPYCWINGPIARQLGIDCAQVPSERMKAIHMAAVRIADRIGVEEPARSEFIQLYQEFKKESAAVLTVKPAATGNTEDDIEAKISADFEKSEKILSLRKAYYEKFRTILTPSQIQAMYDIEKEYNARR